MNVYKWNTPTTKYPDLNNIIPIKPHNKNIKLYKYMFLILIIIVIIILDKYGSKCKNIYTNDLDIFD